MNNAALIRTLIIYAVCVPLAVFVGYQLTDPLTYSTFGFVGILILILVFPILMRWHHLLLIVSWNMMATVFFIPGSPQLWLVMVAMSLTVSILQKTMNRRTQFISVPQVAWPLVCMAVVVLATAKLTGGIGLRRFGGDVYGGTRYILLLGAIMGYFALTMHRIASERARLCVAVFFLGGLTGLIGDVLYRIAPSLTAVFWVFPPNYRVATASYFDLGTTRLPGAVPLATAVYCFMMARYGVRGIFSLNSPWRAAVIVLSLAIGLLGGFRGTVVTFAMIFFVQFFLEGVHKTKLILPVVLFGLVMTTVTVAFAAKLPYTFQRALSILPIEVDPRARLEAQGSAEWRIQIWRVVLPQVPKHLLLGTGYALSATDYQNLGTRAQGSAHIEDWDATVVGDYHNGPLSVLLPFGIWGAITFLWFLVSANRVMYFNHLHGPPELQTVNAFLLAAFITKTIMFFVVFGGLYGDMQQFVGLLGFSISLNGGVCGPPQATASETKKAEGMTTLLPRTRPVFQR